MVNTPAMPWGAAPARVVGVIGAGNATPAGERQAYEVGRLLAAEGIVLVTGGLLGVMQSASRGSFEAGGFVLGILPGGDARDANPYVTLSVPTNMGHARNVVIAHTAQALIAVEGELGTLSEIAISLKLNKPVMGLNSWENIPGVQEVQSPEEAVAGVLKMMGWQK
jgi:uncharacterized protein (TIGR00725 family)